MLTMLDANAAADDGDDDDDNDDGNDNDERQPAIRFSSVRI